MALGIDLDFGASEAQEDAARIQEREARLFHLKAMGFASFSEREMASFERQLAMEGRANLFAERAVARQEEILNAVSPGIVESGRQALALLRGGEAASAQPIMAERRRQRDQLVQRFREQGMDESSTPVIQALSEFDRQTGQMIPEVAMGLLGAGTQGLGQATSGAIGAQQLAFAGAGQTQGMANLEQGRLLNTFLQTGAPLAGLAARSQTIGSLTSAQTAGNVFGAGLSLAAMGASGGFGGGGLFGGLNQQPVFNMGMGGFPSQSQFWSGGPQFGAQFGGGGFNLGFRQ